MRWVPTFASLLLLVACGLSEPERIRTYPFGRVQFPASCSEEAQVQVEDGVVYLHHMMYDQARRTFYGATTADPDCAMAYWGMAMAEIQPLSPRESEEQFLKRGEEAAQKARSLNAPTEREQAYVAAVGAYYADWRNLDHATRLAGWEKAQQQIHEQYPGDADAAAFYALALLATAPKDDAKYEREMEAGRILEGVHDRLRTHPGAIRYALHAYDNPLHARRGLNLARAYGEIAPDLPQALIQPSRILIRLGHWDEVISWSLKAAAAAKTRRHPTGLSSDYPLAMDYLIYGYLQGAWDRRAENVVRKIQEVDRFEDNFLAAFALAAIPARYLLDRGEWREAAGLETRRPASFSWDKYPAAEAVTHFARGLGAARNGDIGGARKSVESLDALRARLAQTGDGYWQGQVEAQRQAVAAWIAQVQGKKGEAEKLMRAAADLEDSVDRRRDTAGPVLPLRELLGDLLAESGKPAKALEAYAASLATSPNRFNGLFGAGVAAEQTQAGNEAKRYYEKLVEIAAKSRTTRPAFERAQSFLRSNRAE